MAKLAVLSAWMPACCSPLNGVTTGTAAPASQPRLKGVRGLLNQRPMWVWWTGVGVVAPGSTEKVWESKTPRTVAVPAPPRPVWTSVWFLDDEEVKAGAGGQAVDRDGHGVVQVAGGDGGAAADVGEEGLDAGGWH